MNQFERAAIIGMWRMGAEEYLIAAIFRCDVKDINLLIELYKNSL